MEAEKKTMSAKDLRKLQLVELEMLLEVDRICRENNIMYFIAYGTALGAVRHKGFIPWDDDLDIRMTRKEFEKFERVCKTKLDTDRFFLQTARTDSEYRWGYAKVRRKGTEYLRAGQEAIKCVSGVSIDIFIMDNIPDNNIMAGIYYLVRRGCIKTLWSVIGVTAESNLLKKFLYRGLRHVPKEVPLGIMEWLGKRANKKATKRMCCMSFYRQDAFRKNGKWYERGTVLSEWFEEAVEIEYEGFMVYICKDCMAYIECEYAEPWKYPPESQRLIHPPKSYNLDVEIDLRGCSIEEQMKKEYLYLTKEDWEKGRGE
ncbi:MAG: LicD family protein [Clostridiales bacterium]|nr:LicD family protein [Roseburia sp.]MDD7636659.1 LicD family protein [Clostridiales bacterium]MDY4114256.1 LicD family protein [Roseburia sp.]